MAPNTRTFVAIRLPDDVRHAIGRLQDSLATETAGVRWVGLEQLHITLAFLGDVDDAKLDDVVRAVASAAAVAAPFALTTLGLGAFPTPARPRNVWLGVAGPGLDALEALQRSVADELSRAGWPADERFTPHVTIGRVKPGRGRPPDLRPIVDRQRGWSAGSFRVVEVVTYASTLGPQGPSYRALARARLGRTETDPSP